MRVLIAAPVDTEIGGVASVVTNLARDLQSRGHDVHFLYSAKTLFVKQKATKAGFHGFYLRMQALFGERNPLVSVCAFLFLFPVTFLQLLRLLKKHRIEVINVHYPLGSSFYLALCSRLLRVKLVVSIHGAEVFPTGRPRPRYSSLFNFLLASADAIIAPSKRFMKTFLSVFPHLEGKTTFVHNGIDTAEFDSCPQKTSAGRYILTVSTCKPQKGIDVLVRAFQRLHDSDPALKLLIAGDGPLRGELTELASSSGIQSHIEFLGWKGREEVVRVLQGCEVFVLPSRFETFGIAILEAWACGKPVVATTAGGIPEIVENGKNGILVEPDNPAALAQALASVLQDSALRSAIAANGYTTLHRRFLRKHTGSAYETAFANLLASSGKQLAGATTERSV